MARLIGTDWSVVTGPVTSQRAANLLRLSFSIFYSVFRQSEYTPAMTIAHQHTLDP